MNKNKNFWLLITNVRIMELNFNKYNQSWPMQFRKKNMKDYNKIMSRLITSSFKPRNLWEEQKKKLRNFWSRTKRWIGKERSYSRI